MTPDLDISRSALLTDIAMCLNYYRLSSPGLYCCTLVPVQLDATTRLSPDVMLMVNYGPHKQCAADESHDFFTGPPNFALDVFSAGELADYEQRRSAFENAGVLEYVALWDTDPITWHWNRRIEGRFTLIEADDEPGMIRSMALPGLWIPTGALRDRNWWAIMASIAQGVTRRGHHDLMDSIWRK